MRDKFKRRKKTQDDAAPKPAPLQPAYFEPEPEPEKSAASEAAPETRVLENEPLTERAPSEDFTGTTEPNAVARPAGGIGRPRRRRRGGRGRRRPAQQAAAAASAAPTEMPASPTPVSASPRATKGVVVLAIGLPGSGKSSWFKRHNITPLSSDLLRSLLFDDPAEQGFQDLVFSNLRSMLRARLLARRPLNYVDATNLTPHDRQSWIKLAKDFGYEVQAVFFDVPLEVCLERNHRRPRIVSDDVMQKMSEKLKAPTFDEGFSKITVVRVKQQSPA